MGIASGRSSGGGVGRSGDIVIFEVLDTLDDRKLLVNVERTRPERQPTHVVFVVATITTATTALSSIQFSF